ncbi:MAG TPA: hypothetical protein VJQ45_01305 [Ktedonobacterales bacterium]|nr:hypothetical protein [Ktedonobacterales bacterium]
MSTEHDTDAQETAPPPQPLEAEVRRRVASVELDDLLRRRRTRGQRMVRFGALAVALLLAAALVAHASGVRLPTPQTQVPRRPVGVALVSNITYGTLTLNGRRLSGPPPQAVTLRDGTNAIALAAPPFQPRQCSVTWPDLSLLSGQCSVSIGYLPDLDTALEIEYQIALDFDIHELPPDVAASARATVSAAIIAAHYETPVPAGQPIATGWTPRTGAIDTIPAPPHTQAQLSFTPAATPACPDGLCVGSEFLPSFPGRGPPVGPAWMVNAGFTYTWRFVTQDGTVLGSVTYPTDVPVSFAIAPNPPGDGGWHLWQPSLPSPPAPTDVMLSALTSSICDWANAFRVAQPGVPSPPSVGVTIGPGIQGCAFTLQTPGGGDAGTLLWRFGVLLAADPQAHASYPKLPMAPAGALEAIGSG